MEGFTFGNIHLLFTKYSEKTQRTRLEGNNEASKQLGDHYRLGMPNISSFGVGPEYCTISLDKPTNFNSDRF